MRRTALGLGVLAMMWCGTAPAGAQVGTAPAGAQVGTAPAGAQVGTAPAGGDTTDAVVNLQSELSALMDLAAFDTPPSARLRGIHDQWSSSLAGLDRTDLIWWVQDSDAAGNATLDELRSRGLQPSDAITAALGVLSEADYAALAAGGKVSIRPGVYENALDDLDPLGRSVTSRQRRSVPITTPSPSPSSASPSSASASSSGLLLTLITGVGVIAVAGVVVVLLRRRRGRRLRALEDDPIARLLDAARRLSASVDLEEVSAIAVVEAAALSRADAAVFISSVDGHPVVSSESADGTVDPEHLDRSLVGRVLSTGLPARSVVTEEAFGASAVSAMVVPVLRSGQVVGAICVRRPASSPFGAEDQELLCRLSPFVAGAIDAATLHDGVTELSLTDGLTSLANRRRLDRDLPEVMAERRRPVGFLMIDIDHFKTYNDINGHVAGDAALRQVAEVLARSVRPNDVVYRYGGEEFSVLLAEATAAEAVVVAERVRAAVEAFDFAGGSTQPGGRVTISVGLALTEGGDVGEIKERADEALYAAKHRGRNRVEIAAG